MIQGLNNYSLYNSYNRIQYPQLSSEAAKNLTQNSKPDNSQENAVSTVTPAIQMDLKLDAIRPRTNASVEDISLSLAPTSSFEMKGRESNINSLDMTKAVSDMQKDEALQQYQFFVGNQPSVFESSDGVVISKTQM